MTSAQAGGQLRDVSLLHFLLEQSRLDAGGRERLGTNLLRVLIAQGVQRTTRTLKSLDQLVYYGGVVHTIKYIRRCVLRYLQYITIAAAG